MIYRSVSLVFVTKMKRNWVPVRSEETYIRYMSGIHGVQGSAKGWETVVRRPR